MNNNNEGKLLVFFVSVDHANTFKNIYIYPRTLLKKISKKKKNQCCNLKKKDELGNNVLLAQSDSAFFVTVQTYLDYLTRFQFVWNLF